MKDLKVFIAHREVLCAECGEQLGRHAWITLDNQKGPVCLACADLEHLAYLPAGNTALTRRARKNSRLSAVVLKWSRARKQYERQGVLIEEGALQQAEAECAADEALRMAARVREAERRAELDEKYIESFAHRIRDMYPGAPAGREMAIAVHACRKYSGRVGRSSSAKALDAEAVKLAVVAHIRHVETDYDVLLTKGYERYEAREQVRPQVEELLDQWQKV
jgi:hypothetical protein